MSSPVRRRYESPLRQRQAEATRLAIIEAATRLFVDRGFVSTSVDLIAETAGVSRATVFTAVGGKAVLLKTAYDVALVGDDEPVPMPQRPWAQGVAKATTPAAMLEAYADLMPASVFADRRSKSRLKLVRHFVARSVRATRLPRRKVLAVAS